jgi:integrase
MPRITKRSVDAIASKAKDTYIWDDELKGFGLKVTPAGKKVFLVQYRLGGRLGRTRRYTIGQYGVVTPEQARNEARHLLGDVAAGRDPAEAKDSKRADKSLGICLDQFLTEHADSKLKDRSAREYRRIADVYILPTLRHRQIKDIARVDLARFHGALKSKPYQANRCIALLSKFFNWTEKHGFRPDGTNPCRHIERYKEDKRERFLSETELAALSNTLTQAEKAGTASRWVIAAIRLLMLTGARHSEILTLKWAWIDFERACIRLPDSKTGAKTLYLNAPALEVLANTPQLEGNPHVICGEKHGAHLVNLQKPWRRIRKAAKLDDLRIHDLRHSFASVAVAGGMSLPMIGALLGHSQPSTTARYAHLSSDPLRAASEAVAGRISGSLTEATPAEIANYPGGSK